MKNSRFATLFACAVTLSAFSAGNSFAQPPANTAPIGKTGKANGGKGMRGVSKRMVKAIEEKLGKPLTAEQKIQLGKAQKARLEATRAAQEKFLQDAAVTTGLSVESLRETLKPGKRGGQEPKAN
ncbi:MAG TPA: hypothetical protein VGB45_07820 [Abditibacterium sp.]|jgi:hypothetical protein